MGIFNFFKRTKIEEWELLLLKNVITNLPKEYLKLINQIDDGLFRNVLLDASDIPGYVSFGFNFNVYKKYCNENEKSYKLTSIKVYDNRTSTFLNYAVYVSSGVINGYSLERDKKSKIDVSRIDVSGFRKEIIGESDYSRIVNILNEEERKVLTSSEVYSVFVKNKEYFHIKDLEDGDFIGIDKKKFVYKITHDPLEVVLLNQTIIDVFKQPSK
ncbi:hypothetical protein FXV77_10455 [Sphingobacterium phlebotomi]|uniref:Uncharacterized protein n=1 Tax=Sphingobacterium phlebotomi TaxID=2605433 RepID=A0A5D4HBY5_9SPHI|nr:hypothetical protein [Sphingobacterium phlebotomi]TYR36320.1 hypothetical protein FXV77_10455 [Sphingobacterium phlebotomi]